MALNPERIEKIARMAKLNLTPQETEKFTGEMSAILNYVDVLQEVDVAGVEATAQVTGLTNVLHKDMPEDKYETFPDTIAKDTLASSNQPKELSQIKVPNVL